MSSSFQPPERTAIGVTLARRAASTS